MPTPEAAEAADCRELVLAGFVVSSDQPPEHRCRRCGYESPRPRSPFGWEWAEANVDESAEHLRLEHDNSAAPVSALVGRPVGLTLPVQIAAQEPEIVADLCDWSPRS
jgi:hypothetical protein